MTSVDQWLRLLDEWYPPSWAEEWDNIGLQVGDRAWDAERVLVALDPTAEVVAEASENRCGLVVTHHPLLFEPLTRIDVDEAKGRTIAVALSGRVAVNACHTNADVASPGVTDALADALELEVTGVLDENVHPVASGGGLGLGRMARPREPLGVVELAERCRDRLKGEVRTAGESDREVRTVALCGGAGAALIPSAIRAGADVYVTGDVKHHEALDAAADGLTMIDAGHHGTEWPFVPHLARRLEGAGLGQVLVSEVSTDPFGSR